MAIRYFNEDIDFQLRGKTKAKAWIETVLRNEGYTADSINYIFCSDQHLLTINKGFLNHDTYTDIITFDYTENTKAVAADIYISIDRVRENSNELKKDFNEELHRVMIHGILHIMGYSDKTTIQKQEMREKEDACLSLR